MTSFAPSGFQYHHDGAHNNEQTSPQTGSSVSQQPWCPDPWVAQSRRQTPAPTSATGCTPGTSTTTTVAHFDMASLLSPPLSPRRRDDSKLEAKRKDSLNDNEPPVDLDYESLDSDFLLQQAQSWEDHPFALFETPLTQSIDPNILLEKVLTGPKRFPIYLAGLREGDGRLRPVTDPQPSDQQDQDQDQGQPIKTGGSVAICDGDKPDMGWDFTHEGLDYLPRVKELKHEEGVGWRDQEAEAEPLPDDGRWPAKIPFTCQLCGLKWAGVYYKEMMWAANRRQRNAKLLRPPANLERDPDFSRADIFQFNWFLDHDHEDGTPCVRDANENCKPTHYHPDIERACRSQVRTSRWNYTCCPPGQAGNPYLDTQRLLVYRPKCPFDNCPTFGLSSSAVMTHLYEEGHHLEFLRGLKSDVLAHRMLAYEDRVICSRLINLLEVDETGKLSHKPIRLSPDEIHERADPAQHVHWTSLVDAPPKSKRSRKSHRKKDPDTNETDGDGSDTSVPPTGISPDGKVWFPLGADAPTYIVPQSHAHQMPFNAGRLTILPQDKCPPTANAKRKLKGEKGREPVTQAAAATQEAAVTTHPTQTLSLPESSPKRRNTGVGQMMGYRCQAQAQAQAQAQTGHDFPEAGSERLSAVEHVNVSSRNHAPVQFSHYVPDYARDVSNRPSSPIDQPIETSRARQFQFGNSQATTAGFIPWQPRQHAVNC